MNWKVCVTYAIYFTVTEGTLILEKCNWCGKQVVLLTKKKFCYKCSLNGQECRYCHRPMPSKYFQLHATRCNSCFKKHEKQKLKRKQKWLFLEWELSCDTKVTYERNTFGPRIKFEREKTFFGLSRRCWNRFRANVPLLLKPDHIVHVAPYKRVYYKTFNGETFICFEQDWKSQEGVWKKSWINLNLWEWDKFMKSLGEIDKAFGYCPTTKTCYNCNDVRTLLTAIPEPQCKIGLDEQANVLFSNTVGIEPLRCELCGDDVEIECHCHKFTCRDCSPENYCNGCGQFTYQVEATK